MVLAIQDTRQTFVLSIYLQCFQTYARILLTKYYNAIMDGDEQYQVHFDLVPKIVTPCHGVPMIETREH